MLPYGEGVVEVVADQVHLPQPTVEMVGMELSQEVVEEVVAVLQTELVDRAEKVEMALTDTLELLFLKPYKVLRFCIEYLCCLFEQYWLFSRKN